MSIKVVPWLFRSEIETSVSSHDSQTRKGSWNPWKLSPDKPTIFKILKKSCSNKFSQQNRLASERGTLQQCKPFDKVWKCFNHWSGISQPLVKITYSLPLLWKLVFHKVPLCDPFFITYTHLKTKPFLPTVRLWLIITHSGSVVVHRLQNSLDIYYLPIGCVIGRDSFVSAYNINKQQSIIQKGSIAAKVHRLVYSSLDP